MISVEQAREQVLRCCRRGAAVTRALDESLGLALAADIVSDVDSPPHDKALVDGYAVRSADFAAGSDTVELTVLEEITAGRTPSRPLEPGAASRVMTGAPVPAGCDAVVMIEQSELQSDRVRLTGGAKPEQNLMRQGASMRQGEVVLQAGQALRPIEIGVLAEVGCVQAPVFPRATVAVLATGDELVPADQSPAAGQIRNSNSPMLQALVRRAGGEPQDLGIARDQRAALEQQIRQGLRADVLVLSGGVSAGVLDLVPPALRACGVREVFHKVRLKPGKPLWFGVHEDRDNGDGDNGDRGALVFGLPGNPVSSLVCFELFVRPALGQLSGRADAELRRQTARLESEFQHRGDRPTWHPSHLTETEDRPWVRPLPWRRSADLRTLADANCLAQFDAGDRLYKAGEPVVCWML